MLLMLPSAGIPVRTSWDTASPSRPRAVTALLARVMFANEGSLTSDIAIGTPVQFNTLTESMTGREAPAAVSAVVFWKNWQSAIHGIALCIVTAPAAGP